LFPFVHYKGVFPMNNRLLAGLITLTLVVRLYNITFPVAGWHSWRQSDTAAMARNFAEERFDIMYPAIDWRGATPGYVECEFQVYTFLVALLYKFFGIYEIFGRLLSVLCSIGTVLGLFLLVKKFVDERTALWSVFLYAVLPLSIFYGRAFMPEQMMLMSSVLGIYFFTEWIDTNKLRHFIASALFVSLAVLIKLPALYLGLPLMYVCWKKYRATLFAQPLIWVFVVVVFGVTAWWYYHAHLLKLSTGLTFGIWGFGTDKWGNSDLLLSLKFYNDVFFKSIAERHFTYAAFILFVIGLFLKRSGERERLFDVWLIAVVVYILIVAKGNQVHEYYNLPFMLPAVVFAGKTIARFNIFCAESWNSYRIRTSLLSFCVLATLVLSTLRLSMLFNGETYHAPLFTLASAVKEATLRDDLCITVSEGNPVMLYFCGRKGWTCGPAELDSMYIQLRIHEGARYIVAEKEVFERNNLDEQMNLLFTRYTVVKNEQTYFMLQL
jgi:hypothetical protein